MKNKTVKILATIGLIIAIFLILRGVFDVGKIGFKNFSSKLPTLKCEIFDPNAKNTIEFYDLDKIKNDDPTRDISREKYKELLSQENLNIVTFVDIPKGAFKNHYQIRWIVHEDGIRKNMTAYIKQDTGEFSLSIPTHTPITDISWDTISKSSEEGRRFNGVCDKVERKNL